MTTDSNQAALDHYNAHFKPTTYRTFRVAMLGELTRRGERTDSELTSWMNRLTDAALGIAGHLNYADMPQRFAVELGQLRVSDEVMRTAVEHLRHFEREGSQMADDVAVTASLVRDLEQLSATFARQLATANTGHLATHRAAAYLLSAADLLTRTAHIVLSRQMPSYTAEKARRARDNVRWAFDTLTAISPDYAYYFRPLATSITTGAQTDE